MPQPTPYARQFSFTDHEAAAPTTPAPGTSTDAEFDAIAVTAAAVLANLLLIQRDDGALKNAIVTLDSMSPAALETLGAGSRWTPLGAWVTATDYVATDVVSEGTATYVCAVDHTAAALLATDVAAGKWVLLFDSAGNIPADGSVTTPKLADGAVTTPKIGFTSLDLTGSIRGQGGLAAGTAPAGALLHAKKAAGDVYGKVERTTDAQGAVGYQIIGVGVTWTVEQALSSNDLTLRDGATVRATFVSGGGFDLPGTLRAVVGAVPTAGNGAGIHFAANVGYLTSYDYGTTAWRDLKLRGKDVYLTAAGVDVLKATSTGVQITGTLTRNGDQLGYLGIPQNQQNGAYTLALTDAGKHIYSENVAGQSIAVPTNAAVAFPVETAILIVNDGTNPITVTTVGVVVRLNNTATVAGSRTIAAGAMGFLLKVDTDRWFIAGAGVS